MIYENIKGKFFKLKNFLNLEIYLMQQSIKNLETKFSVMILIDFMMNLTLHMLSH